ncbi:phage GP46 family protein [Rhodopseudomonas sp. BR0G17]|uniref:phage GP46 family protein n=1 Tax=Rhodopseudomonas sp. BR0G17 TaxID=2269368 RepID=UPI0013DF7F43|nr:phage GP46 family protein [Rhodopseudomonas sp. BR0G17]NEW96650.1 hypothetical protein [Rhodopseudomonas sp. BR0G17]
MGDGVVIRQSEGCAAEATVLWDSVWAAEIGGADYALADSDETGNRGGLRSKATLATAVVLMLFTDRRIDPNHPLWFLADGDRRGYWGDGADVRADLGEGPLGSYLWLLERAPMTVRGLSVGTWAEQFANEALKPLLDQGACARIDITSQVDAAAGVLFLFVQIYAADGSTLYDQKFSILWNQVAR